MRGLILSLLFCCFPLLLFSLPSCESISSLAKDPNRIETILTGVSSLAEVVQQGQATYEKLQTDLEELKKAFDANSPDRMAQLASVMTTIETLKTSWTSIAELVALFSKLEGAQPKGG